MKRAAAALVLASAIGLPLGAAFGVALPLSTAPDHEKMPAGTIKSVASDGTSFVISHGVGNDKKETTVLVNNSTRYTLDGKDSTKDAALKVGHHAKVTLSEGTASKVDVKTDKKPS